MNTYDPPVNGDIVEYLRYEARYTETAVLAQDECTENYGLMCRTAADEIERLRNALASAQSAGDTDVTPGTSGSEQALQAALRVHAPKRGARLYRNNNGACLDENGRMIRYGLGNDSKKLNDIWKSSDLIGICADGKFLAVEVKKPGWKLTPGDKRGQAQLKFIETIRAMGGRAGFAQSIEDFERIVGQ